MCAHYKYTRGGLRVAVGISGGWLTTAQETAAIGEYFDKLRDEAPVQRTSTVAGPKAASASGDNTGSPPAGELVDIFPGDMAELLIVEDGKRKIVPSKYGLVPPWVPKGKKKPLVLYNCRDDSLNGGTMKPSFRDPFLRRRGIAAVSVIEENMGNHLWLEIRHSLKGQDFFVASIYNYPHELSDSVTHAFITTTPNEKIAPYHDRMPVILGKDEVPIWIDPETPVPVLLSLLKPCPVEWIGPITERQDEPPRRKKKQGDLDFD
ncbi:MAG: SOS response-associated peptidase family protein [Armatimonadetes bacterium]|nr:SOS response-associated peptidase family protein [Armatimonadota bacterium]